MSRNWDPVPFQNMLRAFLDRRGWSQNDLAKAADISQAALNRWMQPIDSDSPAGVTRPNDDTLRKLASVIGQSHHDLLKMVGRLEESASASPMPKARPPELTALMADLDAAWPSLSAERRDSLGDAVRGIARVHRPRRRNRRTPPTNGTNGRDSNSLSIPTYALLTA